MNSSKNIHQVNAKGERYGYWEVYDGNGKLGFKCVFHNDKEIGYEEYYSYYSNKRTKIYNI